MDKAGDDDTRPDAGGVSASVIISSELSHLNEVTGDAESVAIHHPKPLADAQLVREAMKEAEKPLDLASAQCTENASLEGAHIPVPANNVPPQTGPTPDEVQPPVTTTSDEADVEMTSDTPEDESDAETELSEGKDFMVDLRDEFEDLDFMGTYAISHTFPHAPNPWLVIDGMGLISLPLSESDAQRIIASASQAPYGHGTETVVNPEVRKTWEVARERVSFMNKMWQSFIMGTVVSIVREGLGVLTPPEMLRCELYKLLLYETGGHFLPHQDTQKAEGMFATVVVILPSFYTGGEVRVSHSSFSKTLALPLDSMMHTNVLAWYTDVMHSVTPVQSGYRLALSYNLSTAGSDVSKPVTPMTEATLARIRRIFRKRSEGMYTNEPDFVAHILDHQYSTAELDSGAKSLKGRDAQIVKSLVPIASEFKQAICFAKVERTVTGEASELDMFCGGRHAPKRGRYSYDDDDDDDEDCPDMSGSEDMETTLSNMVDLAGNRIIGQHQAISLDEKDILQEEPFMGEPDRKKYGGYMGNESGDVQYWYYRTVMLIMDQDEALDFGLSRDGPDYVLLQLQAVSPSNPTPQDRRLVEKCLTKVAGSGPIHSRLQEIAAGWRDIEFWKKVDEKVNQHSYDLGAQKYQDAIQLFGFEAMRPRLEDVLAKSTDISQSLRLMQYLEQNADAPVSAWCKAQRLVILEKMDQINLASIQTIIQIAQTEGLVNAVRSVLPALERSQSDAGKELINAVMQSRKESFAQGPDDPELQNLLLECLDKSITRWVTENSTRQLDASSNRHLSYYPNANRGDPRIHTSINWINVCLSLDARDRCQRILDVMRDASGPAPERFKVLYVPFIPTLLATLARYNTTIMTPPFSIFAQGLVGLYLQDILGGKKQFFPITTKYFGCADLSCADCKAFNAFVALPQVEYRFSANQQRRKHLSSQLYDAHDLVTERTETTSIPHVLYVTKKPEAIAANRWDNRQSAAKIFFNLFGGESVVMGLMGNRAVDVVSALNGTRGFQWTAQSKIVPTDPIVAPPTTAIGTSTSTAGPSSLQSTSAGAGVGLSKDGRQLAGEKRKSRPTRGKVIDLTLDD